MTLCIEDRVRLYFDTDDSEIISRINIEGDSVLIQDMYKGTLNVANAIQDEVVLEDVEVFRNGRWQDHRSTMRVPYNGNNPIYIEGNKYHSTIYSIIEAKPYIWLQTVFWKRVY